VGIAALGVFVLMFAVYGFSAIALGRTASPDSAYFDHLADAFLHGRLFLINPPSEHDLTLHSEKWYVPFSPLPALLLIPWVALSGVAGTNTVTFSVIVGAANVTLAFLLLQALSKRRWTQLSLSDNLWLTALFGVGSVHWYMATIGSVWFVSQMCTVTFMLLAAWSAVTTGSPALAGTALALAMLARPHVVLAYPLLLGIALQHLREETFGEDGRRGWRWAIVSAIPIFTIVGVLLGYNDLRFGSALDFGYLQENVARELKGDLQKYGQFNLRYVPHNVWSMLLAGPEWDARGNQMVPTVDGLSLFLTTPALLFLVKARGRSPMVIGAWLALGLLLVPLLTYYNTGWWQFGYRFSLDFMTPVLVLLAAAAGPRVGWAMRVLIILGALVNAWGVSWFLSASMLAQQN
jgi:hypothetical protein